MKEYFELDVDTQLLRGFGGSGTHVFVDEDLIDALNGEAIDYFVPDPALVTVRCKVNGRGPLADRLFASYGGWLLISERAQLSIAELAICSSIRWVPTTVCDPKDLPISRYYLAYGATSHDVWDYAKSDCKWVEGMEEGSQVLLHVNQGTVDRGKAPEWDLFAAEPRKWVASQRLQAIVSERKLTGFQLRRLDAS